MPVNIYYSIIGKKVKVLFLLLSCLIISNTYAIVVVSIGKSCSVAMALRHFNLRHEAYPFDWIISHFTSLYYALEDDFKRLLQDKDLTIREYDRYAVLDYYKFHFVHDFPTVLPNTPAAEAIEEGHMAGGILHDDWRSALTLVQEKYQRRIERLRNLFSSTERVYLIRHFDMTKEQAINFRDLLYRKYPLLDFVLVVIDKKEDMKLDWNLERIKNIYFDYYESSSTKPQLWEPIFRSLNLID